MVAVDWSGKARGEEELIWLAEARDGRLTGLRNGLTRPEVAAWLVSAAREEPRMAVGLDFAFSFPRWWCEKRGWTSSREVWEAMASEGEALLAACEPPLWGRPERPRPPEEGPPLRRTDREAGGGTAKSPFQIGGAGAVGTGSIRGMPHLLTLAAEGFSVWPFDPPGWPRVIEIYPRVLVEGKVRKSRWAERHAYLFERFAGQAESLLERAAGSEDGFDAAVSALVMSRHAERLEALAQTDDPFYAIEGRIWGP